MLKKFAFTNSAASILKINDLQSCQHFSTHIPENQHLTALKTWNTGASAIMKPLLRRTLTECLRKRSGMFH